MAQSWRDRRSEGSSASLDELFDQLSSPARRNILAALLSGGRQEEYQLEEFTGTHTPPGADRVLLHHKHLPKLAHAGYIRWDRDGDVFRRGPEFESIEPLLESLAASEH